MFSLVKRFFIFFFVLELAFFLPFGSKSPSQTQIVTWPSLELVFFLPLQQNMWVRLTHSLTPLAHSLSVQDWEIWESGSSTAEGRSSTLLLWCSSSSCCCHVIIVIIFLLLFSLAASVLLSGQTEHLEQQQHEELEMEYEESPPGALGCRPSSSAQQVSFLGNESPSYHRHRHSQYIYMHAFNSSKTSRPPVCRN